MAATDPMTADLSRFSIRLARPLWIGLGAAMLIDKSLPLAELVVDVRFDLLN